MRKREMQAAIRRGIKLLDCTEVSDWRDKINLDILDLGCGGDCILGQLYQDFDIGLDELSLSTQEAEYYGLKLAGISWWNDPTSHYDREYAKLTQLWKEALS